MATGDRRIPPFMSDNFIRRVLQSPEKRLSGLVSPGQVVADLGCGPGYFVSPIGRLVGPKGKVFAVDFDQKAIEEVRKKVSHEGLEAVVETRVSSAAEIGFIPDQSVDFVFAAGLLCCMTDHSGALGQIKRILKKEGRAYLSVARFAKKSDPRSVTKEEWQGILGNFRVMRLGQGLFNRWAVVSKPDTELPFAQPESSPGAPNNLGCVCN